MVARCSVEYSGRSSTCPRYSTRRITERRSRHLPGTGEAQAASRPHKAENATAGLTLADGDRYASWVRGRSCACSTSEPAWSSHPLLAIAAGRMRSATLTSPRLCGDQIRPAEIRLMDLNTGAWAAVPSAGFAARVAEAHVAASR
jgi:hypothetical protein